MHNRTMETRATKDQLEQVHAQQNNGGETDLRTNQNMVIDKRTMEARPTYGPIRTRSSTREQWRRDRPSDQSEHGHRQVNNGGETDLWINQNTVRSSTVEQWLRDWPSGQSEHGHTQLNNGDETYLRTNQNTVIRNRTNKARPTYGPIRTWSSTIVQWRRDRPSDQSEHGYRQVNNGGETDLWINQNKVRSSTIEQWMRDRPTDQSEHGHRQENNGGETNLGTNQNTVMRNRKIRRDRPTDQSENGLRQEINGGETDLRTNKNTVIDNRTMDARPT